MPTCDVTAALLMCTGVDTESRRNSTRVLYPHVFLAVVANSL